MDTRSDQFMFEVNPQTSVTLSHSAERKDQMSRRKIGSATVDNLSNRIGLQFEEHGSMGCQCFKGGYNNKKDFWPKINKAQILKCIL